MNYSRSGSESAGRITKHFTLLILIPCLTDVAAKLTAKEEATSNMTSLCILNIIQTYLNESKKIALRYDHTPAHEIIVQQLFAFLHIPIMANAEEVPIGRLLDTRINSDTTVILGEHTNITRYLQTNLYTAKTVFLTVIWSNSEIIKGLFSEFWYYNIVNTFVLLVKKDEIDVFYFIPFVKCNENDPVLLDTWAGNSFKYGKMDRLRNRYPVSSLNGCHFNVSVTNIPPTIIFPNPDAIHGSVDIDGIEGRILKTIEEKTNGNFLYKVADDGEKWGFISPSPRGVIGELFTKKIIAGCGLTAPNLERISYLDEVMGCSAVSECISWLVPAGSGKGQPLWILIYIGEFSMLTWIILFLTLVLVLVFYTLFLRIQNQRNAILDNFMTLYSSSLGVSIKSPKSKSLKILFASWIWYGLIIMTAYESSVKSRLTVPLLNKNIDTFKELLESDLELYGIPNTIRIVFQGNEDPDAQALEKRVQKTNHTIDEIVEKMVEERLTGYLREHTTFLYLAYKNRKAIGQIHRVKQCAMQYTPTLYLQKRSPITHIVRRIVPQLLETGILHHWRKWFLQEVSSSSSSTEHIKLSLRHMRAPFVACFVGLSLSVAVFLLEYIVYSYSDSANERYIKSI